LVRGICLRVEHGQFGRDLHTGDGIKPAPD
jgi:hypothetical protein